MGCIAFAKGDEKVGTDLWAKAASFKYFDDLDSKPIDKEEKVKPQ
jgi:hypothetical protein